MNEQHLVATMNEHDDGGGYGGPNLLAAIGTTFADVGVHLHRKATHATIFCVLVPVD